MPLVRLSQVEGSELDCILQEEIQFWRDELSWDYRPLASLIRRYTASGTLCGWAWRARHQSISGYCYYVANRAIGHIGNLYVRSENARPAAYSVLLNRAIKSLSSKEVVQRIESQVFSFNCELAPLFQDAGFRSWKRHFLCYDLRQPVAAGGNGIPEGFRIVPWSERFFFPAVDVVFDAYQGSVDYEICSEYQTPEGCTRFLRGVMSNSGCGSFHQETSYVALDPAGKLAAVLLSSKIGLHTAMIPQISVRTSHQKKGLGWALLTNYLRKSRESGFQEATLSVSAGNERAYRLYARLGFQKKKDFHAFVKVV